MYRPAHFEVTDRAILAAFIRAHPLGLLLSAGVEGCVCDPLPFMLDEAGGVLRAHLARANPHWTLLRDGGSAHVVFMHSGAYISPGWYPSKAETGRVVPTWNYAVVEVRGPVRVHEDSAWLRTLVGPLTQTHEAAAGGSWRMEDAPTAFMDAQLRAIVGIEIEIGTMVGKFKLSQNRSQDDRRGVVSGLEASGNEAENLAALMRALKIGV